MFQKNKSGCKLFSKVPSLETFKIFDKVNPKSFRCRGQKQFQFSFCIALIGQKIY